MSEQHLPGGLVPIPPRHTMWSETYLGVTVPLGRLHSLDIADDIARIRAAVTPVSSLAAAFDLRIDRFLELFPGASWRTLYDGPRVVVPAGKTQLVSYELAYLLDIVAKYEEIEKWEGASQVWAQLRNPSQIPSTFFEIEVAAWACSRTVTEYISFVTAVERGTTVKRPDFFWATRLGELYCECKCQSLFDDSFRRQVERLQKCITAEMSRWTDDRLRLDFRVDWFGNAQHAIHNLITEALKTPQPGQRFSMEDVEVSVSLKESPVPVIQNAVQTSVVPASTEFVHLGPQAASHTLTVPGTRWWQDVAGRLIKDARTQVPKDKASALMIGLPSERAVKAALPKVRELLGRAEYANTPWCALWGQGRADAVWRTGQPFDSRLSE